MCLHSAGKKFLLYGAWRISVRVLSHKNFAKTCYFPLLILKPKPFLLSSEFILYEEFLSKTKVVQERLSDPRGLPRTEVLHSKHEHYLGSNCIQAGLHVKDLFYFLLVLGSSLISCPGFFLKERRDIALSLFSILSFSFFFLKGLFASWGMTCLV